MRIPLIVLLCVSLAGNALLLVHHSSTPPVEKNTNSAPGGPPVAAPVPRTLPADTWELIRTADPGIVTRLRAAGFPQDVIRALIIAQVEEQFHAREKALFPDASKAQYWNDKFYFG